MAKTPAPRTTATANYGWTKPDVGASVDVWGDQINADLDGIDSVIHGIDVRPPPIATTTILGGVKPDGTTIKAAGDGTISTIVVPISDNRIINGDMRIDQRNGGAIVSAVGYAIDRWGLGATVASKLTVQRQPAGAATAAIGFGNFLNIASLSAYTPTASETFQLYQRIEADMVSDFAFGTPSAQAVTLSFWVQSTLTGAFSGSLANDTTTRTYPFTYSIPTANTWTKIAVTIPGDTGGTWVMSGNGIGAILRFDLGAGATFRGPAGAWAGTNYLGATGSVSLVATNAATLYLTGVKLEIGSVATPFNRQSLAKSMADCQRYYQKGRAGFNTTGTAGQPIGGIQMFPVLMRANPTTIAYGATTGGNITGGAVNSEAVADHLWTTAVATAAAYAWFAANWTADAEL